jgi:hypothetical protein
MLLAVYSERIEGPEGRGSCLPRTTHCEILRAAVGAGRIETMGDITNTSEGEGEDLVLHLLEGTWNI